ncbi:MAG: 3'-5' exonuclease [Bacteroidota bacterium]
MIFNFWKKQKDYPDFWQEYLDLFEEKPSKSTPIEQLEFVVFDSETSGLDTKTDKLLTIGAVKVRDNQINLAESFELRILQQDIYKTDAVPIHGIVPNTQKGISKSDAIQQFLKYLGNAILVGHNVSFDIQMINRGLLALGGGKLKNPYLDTAQLAIRVEHLHPTEILKPAHFTLDALCDRYHIRMHDRHNAAGDALLTAFLFLKLMAKLRRRGVKTWKDLRG